MSTLNKRQKMACIIMQVAMCSYCCQIKKNSSNKLGRKYLARPLDPWGLDPCQLSWLIKLFSSLPLSRLLSLSLCLYLSLHGSKGQAKHLRPSLHELFLFNLTATAACHHLQNYTRHLLTLVKGALSSILTLECISSSDTTTSPLLRILEIGCQPNSIMFS